MEFLLNKFSEEMNARNVEHTLTKIDDDQFILNMKDIDTKHKRILKNVIDKENNIILNSDTYAAIIILIANSYR